MKPFNNSSKPQLDMEEASRILEQAFEAAQIEPNTIPLEELVANSLYRQRKRTLQKVIFAAVIAFILLLFVLYISLVPSSFTVQNQMADDAFNPVYRVNVDSFMLVEKVTASIDGRSIPIYETDSHVYTIEPPVNGQMEVTVTLLNRRSSTQDVTVTAVDKDEPVATDCDQEGSLVHLYLSDKLSGVDYDNIRAITLDGAEVTPISVDASSGCVTFSHLEETVNVYVPDLARNELHLILSVS